MNLRKLTLNKVRIFDSYSSLDVPIVRAASRCGLALIGGTAVQLLARKYKVKERRTRSINDLDFLTSAQNKEGISAFKYELKKSGFSPIKMGESEYMLNYENADESVEVDVLISWEPDIEGQFIYINGFLVVDPCYMFLTKVQRVFSGLSTKNESDIQDLNTLYDIIEARNDIPKLESLLSSQASDIDEDALNDLLNE